MGDLKGKLNGNCNRTACQQPGAIYFNHSTRKYYCPKCANTINDFNRRDAMEMFGHDLCTLTPINETDPITQSKIEREANND